MYICIYVYVYIYIYIYIYIYYKNIRHFSRGGFVFFFFLGLVLESAILKYKKKTFLGEMWTIFRLRKFHNKIKNKIFFRKIWETFSSRIFSFFRLGVGNSPKVAAVFTTDIFIGQKLLQAFFRATTRVS